MLSSAKDEPFPVWPENAESLRSFLFVCRQWRFGAMGGVLGLDWPGVKTVLEMRGVTVDGALIDDLEAMEGAAAAVMNAR